MPVRYRHALPALLVLLVLFASQAAYAVQAQARPNGHCAGSAPSEKSCPLPLASELAAVLPDRRPPLLRRAEVPPDTPLSRSVVLLI